MMDFVKTHNARVALASRIMSDVVKLRKHDWLYNSGDYNAAVGMIKDELAHWLQPFINTNDIEDFTVDLNYDEDANVLEFVVTVVPVQILTIDLTIEGNYEDN